MKRLDGDGNEVEVGTICIEDLELGMSRSIARTFTDADTTAFSELSLDYNPIHHDETYARETIFRGRIAHGMMYASLISAVIGEQLPGHGTVYMGQSLKFLAPVRSGDHVEARVTVKSIDYAKRRVTLDCECRVRNKVVLVGEALVLAPSRKFD